MNAAYRRVTTSLGLDAARFVTRSATTTNGQQYVTFTEIEKIDRVLDTTTSTAIRLLPEVSIHTQRSTQPGAGQPGSWAFRNADADSVVILLDTVPQTSYSLQADGWTTLSDLSGSDEPVFPESFHDILVWNVVSEELLKKEKDKLAFTYQQKADRLLSDLRFHLANSPTQVTRQGGSTLGTSTGSGGSGGGNSGGTSYTQSGLLTFDRGSGLAPFAVAQTNAAKVDNLDADKLDGLNSTAFGLVANPLSQFAATTSAELRGVLSDETGTGAAVFATSPTLVTPILGTPTSGTLTNCTGLPVSTGVSGLGTGVATALGVAVGSAGGPVTNGGALGTPSSGTLTNCTGLPVSTGVSGLGTGIATFLATPSSANLAAALTDETGTAGTVPFASTGSWTPSVGGSATYTTQTGTYLRIGNLVIANGHLTINSIGTGSTSAISGLPFNASARFSASISALTSAAANFTWAGLYTTASAATLTFSIQDTADANTADAANLMGNSTTVIFTCIYTV